MGRKGEEGLGRGGWGSERKEVGCNERVNKSISKEKSISKNIENYSTVV
jgi:hypothetical protein